MLPERFSVGSRGCGACSEVGTSPPTHRFAMGPLPPGHSLRSLGGTDRGLPARKSIGYSLICSMWLASKKNVQPSISGAVMPSWVRMVGDLRAMFGAVIDGLEEEQRPMHSPLRVRVVVLDYYVTVSGGLCGCSLKESIAFVEGTGQSIKPGERGFGEPLRTLTAEEPGRVRLLAAGYMDERGADGPIGSFDG